jgi:hypothetical protein
MGKHYVPLKADEKVPVPGEGRRYVLFRPHGSKNLSASILMPDGYAEVLKTGYPEGRRATVAASARIRELYDERKIETPKQIRKRTGEVSEYIARKQRIAAAAGDGGVSLTNGAPLPRGPSPIEQEEKAPAGDNYEWENSLVRIENKMAQSFNRIQMLFLLTLDQDPYAFREHVRAIVLETTLAGVTPTGRIQRKRRSPGGPGRKPGRPAGS